ncbi:T9SS type A sorting domain-containing protein [Dyadobacter flavalbus]|uniref:T9SS type A sorting domain-containing protein n=2 Tax=Dyadobacter flavalbus TaxID=2579942 RepID=A0A5M8R0X6_9BACT|nr:T9SS type A sorting domain-containing protein [Dyadobacter flavalbus]
MTKCMYIKPFYLLAPLRKMHLMTILSFVLFSAVQSKSATENNKLLADGCSPVSTLACTAVNVNLPFSLSFNSAVSGTIADKNGQGTGFTTVNAYSGTRLAVDGSPSNTSVPGYEPSKITLASGRLQIVAGKGIDYLTNNNQLNVLGAKISPTSKIQLQVKLVNPYNGTQSQQAGLWYGLNDKTFIKLGITGNKVELRKETNDVSSTLSGTANPDQRRTETISGLNSQTVTLRMVIDTQAETVEGFYSTDGVTFASTGTQYASSSLSIGEMNLTSGDLYAGIFATYRNGSSAVTYTFDDFAAVSLAAAAQTASINFRPQGTAAPSGYKADNGLPFDAGRGYGWFSSVSGQPADYTANTRLRTGTVTASQLSLLIMNGTANNTDPGYWEYVIANGTYRVTVSAGDNNYYDSNHQINIEGLPAITDFRPSSSNKFRVSTAVVQVSDGRLTIDAKGAVNSKINYVTIVPATTVTDATAPTASARITGTLRSAGVYDKEAKIFLTASDAGGSGLKTFQYAINGGAYTNYTVPFTVNTPGNYSLTVKASDGNNNQTISNTYTFSIYSPPAPSGNGYMVLKNLDNFPANDQLTFSLIQTPWRRTSPDTTAYNANHDKVKLRINSKGASQLVISSLTLSNTSAWKIAAVNTSTSPSYPVNISSGNYADVTVQFIAKDASTRVKVFHDTLTINSNDKDAPVKKVVLHGLYQKAGEGKNEPYAQEIINAFGFTSKTGYTANDGTIKGTSVVPSSHEVPASYFVRADQSKPVTVYQMAAYHGCCASVESFRYHAKGSGTLTTLFTHSELDGQSLSPRIRNSATKLAQASFTPSGSFGIKIGSTSWSDRTKNTGNLIGIRFLKVIDRNGNVVPNAYFVNVDYINNSATNYDYQDLIYYIENVKPESGTVNYSDLASSTSAVNFNATLTGASASVNVTLKNTGTTYSNGTTDPVVNIKSVKISGPNASEFSVGAPGTTTLSAQGTTPVSVKFSPNSVGIKNAELLISYNNANTPLRIPLYGIGNNSTSTVSVVKRIKGGSDSNVTIGGNVYENDVNYRTGSVRLDKQVTLSDVKGTDIDVLYQTYLSASTDLASTGYNIPLANGNYMIRMHFVENYWSEQGARVFSATMENQKIISDFDIFKEVGYRTALVKDFNTTVSDGVLNIQYAPNVNRLALAGIEIFKVNNNNQRTGVEEAEISLEPEITQREINVFPNPNFGGNINIDAKNFGANEEVTFSVINISGRILQSKTVSADNTGNANVSLQLGNDAEKGIYIISVSSESGITRSKLIVE